MTEPDVIDRIVAGVLEQLRLPSAAAPRPVESSPPPKPIGPTASAIEISDGVITGTLLEERGIISGPLVFGRKSVLTPSALEFLATRKLNWRRADSGDVWQRKCVGQMAGARDAIDAGGDGRRST